MKKTGWVDYIAITEEAQIGVLEAPSSAETVPVIASPKNYQPLELMMSEERMPTLSVSEQLRDRQGAGEMDVACYLKGSGTAGTPVYAGLQNLLTGVTGIEDVNAGTNVIYTPRPITTQAKTYSVFYHLGDGMILQEAGVVLGRLEVPIRAKGPQSILQGKFTGKFMSQRRLGTATTTTGSDTTHIHLAAGHAKRFDVGGFIEVEGLTPLPTQISAIDYGTDVLTVSTMSGSVATGKYVKGYMPAMTIAGTIISGWRGEAQLGGADFPVTAIDLVYETFFDVLDDVKNGSDFAADFMEGIDKRKCTAHCVVYFDVDDFTAWYDALNQTQPELDITVGDVAGSIYNFNAPICELMKTPDVDTGGKITLARDFRMLSSSSFDDEYAITLT